MAEDDDLIASAPRLATLIESLEADARIAVDTEFLRERTYYPRLCLVQLAGARALGLVDALADLPLDALHRFLADRKRTKVLHAAHQDLEIFAHATQAVPGPIFDTQLAASLVGFAPQIGFGDLVRELLGVTLEKGHARTDWTRRPLSAAQLAYARDDVRYLLPLAETLAERLRMAGRTDWFAEDARVAEDLSLYVQHPATAWERLKWIRSLSGKKSAAARGLAAWREERALKLDRPRGWILSDAAISELVDRMPRTRAELDAIAELPPAVRTKCGVELIDRIVNASDAPAPAAGGNERLDPEQMALVQRMAEAIRKCAAQLNLKPEVLATQKELRALARGERDLRALKGWRLAVSGQALLALAG
ncbi:MAG: ribonuclease D [Steroidobacteraceae bacterium]